MANPNGMNGNIKWLAIVVTLALGLAGAAYALGAHVGNGDIHETGVDKEDRIHGVLDREVMPWLTHIIEEQNKMKRQLDRIEGKMDGE
jgi:hypothetical protein